MPRNLKHVAAIGLLSAGLALPMQPAALAEQRCYGDWSDAAPIVQRERLRSARDVQTMARLELGSDVVRILLCEAGSGFVYRLVLRNPDGRIGNLTVSAGGTSRAGAQ